jgi:hypothetical protein
MKCLLLTIASTSSRLTASPPPTFTTSNPRAAVDTTTARRSGVMGVRHRVCKHLACCFYLTLSVLFFRRFMAPPITPPTPTSHPIHHAGAQIKLPARRCGSRHGAGNTGVRYYFLPSPVYWCIKLTFKMFKPLHALCHQIPLTHLHPTANTILMLKYISPTKGSSEKRWDMAWNLFFCKFLATLLICTSLVKQNNKTLHNNQTPRDNI